MIRGGSAATSLAGTIVCMVTSQVFLKLAGLHAAQRSDVVYGFLRNPWLWGGLMMSGAGLACWLMTLRNMPLAQAYPWTALIYVLTPLASVIFFDDILHAKYLLGLACIVTGIFVTTSGVETQ